MEKSGKLFRILHKLIPERDFCPSNADFEYKIRCDCSDDKYHIAECKNNLIIKCAVSRLNKPDSSSDT